MLQIILDYRNTNGEVVRLEVQSSAQGYGEVGREARVLTDGILKRFDGAIRGANAQS